MTSTRNRLASARRHYARSLLIAERAKRKALEARNRPFSDLAVVIATHQIAEAQEATQAVSAMLDEQGISAAADALVMPMSFTTEATQVGAMLDQAQTDFEFTRIVAGLVQDAGRAAESVATATRQRTAYVRYLSPPSCARCAILAGRIYRWSEGFKRHPSCDCVMVPTTEAVADGLITSPRDAFEGGHVQGLSKADARAIADGADPGLVVNVRRKAAGLSESGRVLWRQNRMTPEAIYRTAGDDRGRAIQLLTQFGYVR